MAVRLADLPKGHEFAATTSELTPEWVSGYIAAVEDEATDLGSASRFALDVPPLALAALSMRTLFDQAALPEGTIHVGQDLSFSLGSEPASVVVARARIASRGERQGWVLMGIELTIEDKNGTSMMSGRATITFPTEGRAQDQVG